MNRSLFSALVSAVVVCSVLTPGAVRAQTDELPDLDSLDPEEFEVESDLALYHSTGWFPRPHPGMSLMLLLEFGDVWDRAPGIRSQAFASTPFPFSHSDPFGDSDERDIMKSFSEEEEDDTPETGYNGYTLLFTANLPLPLVLRAEAGLLMADGLLFSSDRTRSFLEHNGSRRRFHEVGVVYMEEYLLKGSVGFSIPVYGAFLSNDNGLYRSTSTTVASYYYLHGAITGLYAVSSKAAQYAQIADVKDRLRYDNGADTVRLQPRAMLEGTQRSRTAVSVAVGWALSSQSVSLCIEPFVMIPITPVLGDAEWRQIMGGVRMALGYQWGTGL